MNDIIVRRNCPEYYCDPCDEQFEEDDKRLWEGEKK